LAVAPAIFVGGDCNGQRVVPNAPSPLICGTTEHHRGSDGNYYASGSTPADLPGAIGAIPNVSAKQVGNAWHRLLHVFAVESPQSIRRSRAARARIRRL